MRKALVFVMAWLSVFLIVSCQSTEEAAAPSEPETKEEYNTAFNEVYGRYRSDIILDGAKKYTVKRGDTLVGIAREFYTTRDTLENRWFFPLIMLASSDVVEDPDKLEIGMELTIPDLARNLEDPGARSRIKQFLLDIADVYDHKASECEAESRMDDRLYPLYKSSRDGLRQVSATL
jgi:hypothetical protein